MDRTQLNQRLPKVVESLVKSVVEEPRTQHLNRVYLPSRDTIVGCIERLRQLMFPGYFGKQVLTSENVPYRIGELIIELADLLYEQVTRWFRYRPQVSGANGDSVQC